MLIIYSNTWYYLPYGFKGWTYPTPRQAGSQQKEELFIEESPLGRLFS